MPQTIDTTAYTKSYSEEGLHNKIARNKGLGRTLLTKVFELWYAFRAPGTPAWAKAVIVGALGYFISPMDTIPDFIPGAGYVDDAGVILTALTTISMHVTDDMEQRARQTVDNLM